MLDFGTAVIINTGHSGKITGRAEYDTGVILYLVEFLDSNGEVFELWKSEKEFEIKN